MKENTPPLYRGTKMPGHVSRSNRICFGVDYFDSPEAARAAHEAVRAAGRTYNGGWMDGAPCGRNPGFDYESEGRKLYAVTF